MNTQESSLNELKEIRNLMERSSRFLSLSGLSGISAGIVAILGVLAAWYRISLHKPQNIFSFYSGKIGYDLPDGATFFIADAVIVLILAVGLAFWFTTRRTRKKGLKMWTNTSRRLLISLMIPLITGGIFCYILLLYKLVFLIASATLIFYGLALLNAGKYTLPEIQWLGISEIVLGLVACIAAGSGLLFWCIGFGILHIIYGSLMYFRYESGNR